MELQTDRQTTEHCLTTLAARLEELIRLCEQLAEDNRRLHTRQSALLAEREELVQQNEQARARIDAMVARLRGLELTP
jgi:cell division protein ZapB